MNKPMFGQVWEYDGLDLMCIGPCVEPLLGGTERYYWTYISGEFCGIITELYWHPTFWTLLTKETA